MRKIGYLFSGQGSQFPKMGQDLYQSEPKYREIINEATDVLGINLNSSKEFDNPANIQVAILAMSYGIYRVISNKLPKARGMVGLSLGEYSALLASGALNFSAGIRLVKDRSHYMDEAGADNPGSMAAVLKIDPEKVISICNKVEGAYPANFNTAGQTVIGGTKEGVAKASQLLKEAGAKRVVPLKVAVASHTPLMQAASDDLGRRLKSVNFNQFSIPVVSNTTGKLFTVDNVKTILQEQLIKPTHFKDDLEFLKKQFKIDTLIEIGPGKTLSHFAKKTLKDVDIFHVDSVETLQQTLHKLETEAS